MNLAGKVLVAVLLSSAAAAAQQSASYRIEQSTLNSGGHPSNEGILTSAAWRITLDAIGDGPRRAELGSASFGSSSSWIAGLAPPGEVTGLEFLDDVTLAWGPERSAGSYNLYRGLLGNIGGLLYGGCVGQNLTATSTTDADAVPASNGFFYLVTVENRVGEEGTKGFRSDGIERGGTICP